MFFKFISRSNWPPSCWLATCRIGEAAIEVIHGQRVEVDPNAFSEAVWAGRFEDGDFDTTDVVFGSGGRIRENTCVFVSSASTVDRLQYWETDGRIQISNSLVCLLSHIGADLDVAYKGYYEDLGSITHGLGDYRRTLSTSAGPIELVYFDNLLWNRKRVSRLPKPGHERDFSSFLKYRNFLSQSIGSLYANMRSNGRRFSYRPLGTISTGYDSPTVAVLCKPFGLNHVLSFDRTRHGIADSGEVIAASLGLETHVISRESWKQYPDAEAVFIAADAKGTDITFAGAGTLLEGCVLFTGYHGDKVWDANSRESGTRIVRGDRSGLSLSEFRLRMGSQHVPVPFLGARQLNDIVRISNSPEMASWRTGTTYDRPVCRRIVEEAGIARGAFGTKKKAAAVYLFRDIRHMSPATREDYCKWLRDHRRYYSPWFSLSLSRRAQLALGSKLLGHFVAGIIRRVGRLLPAARARNLASTWSTNLSMRLDDTDPFFLFAFPWAVTRSSRHFREQMRGDKEDTETRTSTEWTQ